MFLKKINKYKLVITAIFSTVAVITFFSCRRDKGVPIAVCNTPQTISFAHDIVPIFQQNCSTFGCHTGTSPAGNLNLDVSAAYSHIMQTGSGYIDTLNPNFSLLYSQMISISDPMPPTGRLDNCKTDLVLKWIQQKAKNN